MSRKGKQGPAAQHGRPVAGRDTHKDPFQAQLDLAQRYEQAGQVDRAASACRQILDADAEHAPANLKLASLYHNAGHHREAAGYWEKVIRADSRNLFAIFNHARCLQQLKRFDEAVERFEQGLKIAGSGAAKMSRSELAIPYFHLAHVYEDMHENEKEEQCLKTAIRLNPDYTEAIHALGYLYRLLGNLDEARACFRQAIETDPEFGAAHRDLALTKKHTELDDDVKTMERLYDSGRLSGDALVYLAFGLGKAYEDLQEYDKAFECWQTGNRLHHQLHPYETDRDLQISRSLKRTFNRAYIRQEASNEPTDITPVFIVSMPRAGSSLTEQILASHSSVYGAGEILTVQTVCIDAVENFPEDLVNLKRRDWHRLGGEYLRKTCEPLNGQTYVTDKLPGNYQHIGIIRMMFPNAKIVHCRRDPMDTALSCYKTNFQPGAVPYSYNLDTLGVIYREYEKLMAYWRKVLPGWVYDIDYERLTADPENQVRQLLAFLDLPFEDACLSFHTSKRVTRTASTTQVRQKIHRNSVRKWKHYEKGLQPFRKARRGSLFGF